MLASVVWSIAFLLASTIATPSNLSPFFSPLIEETYGSSNESAHLELERRQDGCSSGYSNCAGMGAPGSCCAPDTKCDVDMAGHVACCPNGADCTGTISASATVTGGLRTTTTSSAAATSGFIAASGTTATSAKGGHSTISNAYFPFVVLPTTYSNAGACSSYYSSCQKEYASCTNSLGGSVNGITVTGGGGGITVQGTTATVQATSVCSSLSSQACHGLKLSQCSTYGGSSASGTGAVFSVNAAPTGCAAGMYGLGLGVAVGVAGQVLG